jgi:hypothetical protein
MPLQRYATLTLHIHSKARNRPSGAIAHPLDRLNSAPAGRFPSRTVAAAVIKRAGGSWRMLRQATLPTRRKYTHAADVAAANIQP